MSKNMRVRFSGLIIFLGNILSFLLGFVFAALIARGLTREDMGIWFFLGSLLTYFKIFEKLLPYWSLRDIPRGWNIAKTSILFNLLISIPLMIIFIALSDIFAHFVGTAPLIFIIGSLFIPIYYVSESLVSIIFSKEPHKLGLRNILIDGTKIPLALIMLQYGLLGVLVAVIIANLTFILYGLLVSSGFFERKINLNWVNMRLKHAWLPAHESIIGYLSAATDIFILGILTSPIQISFYGIAMTVAKALKSTADLTSAIYPKLLGAGSIAGKEVKELFRFHYIFSLPMLVGGIILAPNLIAIFGSKYLDGLTILYILMPSVFIGTLSLMIRNIVLGLEKADAKAVVKFSGLVRSKLFLAQAASYIMIAVLILGSIIMIPYLGGVGVALSRLAASITSLAIYLYLARGILGVGSLLSGLFKPLITSILMAAIIYIINPSGTLMTLAIIAFGAAFYFLMLVIIDKHVKALMSAFIKEVVSKLVHYFE